MSDETKVEIGSDKSGDLPEGGWGWVITIGMAFMFVVTVGPMASFGLIFGEYLTNMGEGTKSVTVITSILFSAVSLTGLVTNYSLKSYSCRQVGVFGSILYFIGNFLTIFASSVTHLIIAFAIIPGVGMGLMAPASFSCFNTYFFKQRKLAMGIAQIIMGAGAAVFPLLVQVLVDAYGFRGAQAVLTSLSLHALLAMSLLKPVTKKTITNINGEVELEDNIIKAKSTANEITQNDGILVETTKSSGALGRSPEDLKEDDARHNLREKCKESPSLNNKHVDEKDGSKEDCNMSISRQELQLCEKVEEEAVEETSLVDVDSDEDKQDILPLLVTDNAHEVNGKSAIDGQYHPPVHVAALFPLQRIASDPRPSITSVRSWMLPGPIHSTKQSMEESLDKQSKRKNGAQAVVDLLDLTLLQDPVYVSIVLGVSFVYFADLMFFLLLPIIVTSMAFSTSEAAVCLSVGFAGDLVGRLFLVGMALVWPSLTSRRFFFVGALFSVLLRTGFTFLSSYYALLTLSGLMGFFRGWVLAPLVLVFAEYCEADRFPSAYGLFMVINGLISVSLGPVVGYVRDVTASYPNCVHTLTAMTMVCIVLWTVESVTVKLECLTKKSSNTPNKNSK